MTEKHTRTVSLDPENDRYLQDQHNASALVNELVDQLRRGKERDVAALEMQLESKRKELAETEEKAERLRDEIAELEDTVAEISASRETDVDAAARELENIPEEYLSVENEAVLTKAAAHGVSPEEIVKTARQQRR